MPEQRKDPESHRGRNIAMGAAAAAPFAGMIGQQPIIHDPLRGAKGKKFRTLTQLSHQAQAGDVMVLSKPTGSLFKRFITPQSGSEFYHAQPVVGKRGKDALTTDVGYITSKKTDLKSMMSRAQRVSELDLYNYPDVVLLRPKKPLTPAQQKVFQQQSLGRSHMEQGYDPQRAAGSFIRDTFMPKIKGITGTGAQQATGYLDTFQSADSHMNPLGKPTEGLMCSGNTCATVPAQAMEAATSRGVVPGKSAQNVYPTDFLRSNEYELVGSHIKSKYHNQTLVRAAPYLLRGGLGIAGAGAAYGVSEKPEAAGAVAGALGTSMLASKINRAYSPSLTAAHLRLPHIGDTFVPGIIGTPFTSKQVLARWAARRVPILAAGGAAGWYGTKKIREHLADKNKQQR